MTFNNGVFIIDGKKEFIFSAEIHYFRLPQKDWEDRLEKIKNAGIDTISFYVPWFWHEIEDGTFDFHGKTDERRNLLGFMKIAELLGFNIIFKPGPYIMSELKNEGLPAWIYEKIPHAIAKTLDGKLHPTRVFSYLHPDFLRYVERWYDNVFSIAKEFNVVLIQIDNEVGMLQWITGHGDYNEDTLNRFSEFLKDNDKELCEELKTWTYGKKFSQRMTIMYHKFLRLYYAKYLDTLSSYIRKFGIDVPVIVNIHGFDTVEYAKRGKNYVVGVSQLMKAKNIENSILSGDYYIGNIVHENFSDLTIANSLMYAIQNVDQPLFSAEFQSGFQTDRPKLLPSTLELTSRLCIGQGMNGINYYMFAGGVNPDDYGLMGSYHDWQAPIGSNGELRRSYFVLKEFIAEIRDIEEKLLRSKPVFDTFFGFIPSYYSTEHFLEHGMNISEISFKRDISVFDGILRGLKLLNYNFKFIDLENGENIDPCKYNSLWVFSLKFMPRVVQQKLVRYVESGGKLILFPEVPFFDEFGNECTNILKMLGISNVNSQGGGFAKIFDTEVNAYNLETYKLDNECKVYGISREGDVCAFKKDYRNGAVLVLGCGIELEREYKLRVIESICNIMNIQRSFELVSEDGFLDGYMRRSDMEDIFFVNNYDDYDKKAKIIIGGSYITTAVIHSRSGKIFVFERSKIEKRGVTIHHG
ncbi:MAG: beta-galactosidase [Fervidobacterium sp.]|nr:beta-galactosidase [Fervidobacterium sp.]